MRILGVDPGLQITGYGCVALDGSAPRLIEGGVVRSAAQQPLEQRLLELYRGIADVCRELAPDVVVVEDLYAHYAHPRTAIIMGHARGVLFLAAAEQGIPATSYGATRIKKSLTGNGRSSKAQVQAMVQRALSLTTLPEPADVADAIAVALCHANVLAHTANAEVPA